MSDDGWSDEETSREEIKYELGEVVSDYIPTTNDYLTLIKYDLVYIFKKGDDGWWEGETKGVYGKFPSSHVKLLKPTSVPVSSDYAKSLYYAK